jgi:threonine synthase
MKIKEAKLFRLRCISCEAEYGPDELDYTCPQCGPRHGTLEVIYDYRAIKRAFSCQSLQENSNDTLWRYLPVLPVHDETFIQPLKVGWTPLYRFEALAREYGCAAVHIKDDSRNPTASYKDRASCLAVLKAQEKKKRVVTCASTGNAASSLAGFAAGAKLPTVIFVPKTAPEAKVAQLLVYGAHVFAVEGSYDEVFDLCVAVAERYGWYNRSSAINPYLVEGKKTGALEIAEQLGWQTPDKILVPVGDGSVISGVYKGFYDLMQLGFIEEIPQIIGVQAEGANALERAFQSSSGEDVRIADLDRVETVADSISVGKPRDVVKAVKYLRRSGGSFISVSDQEILRAIAELARKTGIFAEPAAAAAWAGFVKLASLERLKKDERIVVMITGSGLKDIAAARKAVGQPHVIRPVLSDVEKVIKELNLNR